MTTAPRDTRPASPAPLPTHAGRVAVVTGAGRGIGQELCRALASRGAAVAGIDVSDLAETGALIEASGARWLGITADVTDLAAIDRARAAVDDFGGADILVNNAAIDDAIHFDELDLERWRRVIQVDLEAPFLLCKAFVPGMRSRGWGRIVNIATGVVMNPMQRFVAYRAAKMGVIGLSRALATELGNDGITVNVVSPGVTRTTMAADSLGDAAFERAAQARAIQRVAVPADIAGAVLFASSEDCAFVTGQTFMANGGAYFL
jgi:NAD(P)-dependent dehydrogenase (short-subunit alcohol dehydrogenase family)